MKRPDPTNLLNPPPQPRECFSIWDEPTRRWIQVEGRDELDHQLREREHKRPVWPPRIDIPDDVRIYIR